MARVYIVPSSKFLWGQLGAAAAYERDKEKLLARQVELQRQADAMPARIAECDANIARTSLEQWRIS
jgi:hypothetical protein